MRHPRTGPRRSQLSPRGFHHGLLGIVLSLALLPASAGGVGSEVTGGSNDSEAPAGLLAEARDLAAAGRAEEARAVLIRAIKAAPSDPTARALLGHLLLVDEQYSAALVQLERAAELGATGARFLFDLGAARWENGDAEAAARVMRRAAESSGRAPVPVHQLGRLELWRGNYSEAVELLNEAAAAMPRAVDVHYDLARALELAGRAEEASLAYGHLLEQAPGHIQGHYGLARTFLDLGRRDEAAEELAVYHRLYREDQERIRRSGRVEGRMKLARRLIDDGAASQALELLQASPATVEVLLVRSLALRALGRFEEAIRQLERAVGLDPQRADLRALLAELRSKERGEP